MGDLIRYDQRYWEELKRVALDSVTSPHTRRSYATGLYHFFAWYCAEPRPPLSKAVVNAYRVELETAGFSASAINVRLSALRKLVSEAADNGLMTTELAASIVKVRGAPQHGVRIGNWLTRQQAERLINIPQACTITGKRDHAVLAVLIGCGLRRSEAAALTFDHLQEREGRSVIVDLVGKHGRIRSVPVPDFAEVAIDQWSAASGILSGRVFRPINKGGKLTHKSVTAKCIWCILRKYTAELGWPKLAPHDLRRTYAKLAYQGGAKLEQIQMSLGHASIQTTELYLGVKQDFSDAPCDHLGLKLNLVPTEEERAA